MGCVASKASAPAEDATKKVEEPVGVPQKSGASKSTRARRLSVVVDKKPTVPLPQAEGEAAAEDTIPAGHSASAEDLKKAPPGGTARNSTRGRRLSYVTNDKSLAEKIAAEYGQYEEESTLHLDNMGGGEPAGPRQIQVQVACMSRAGREPGYKKTNQDNCFAFEKFIGEDQSLFGAMDGHGPHGHLVSGFVKNHLPIALVNHITGSVDLSAALTTGFLEVDENLKTSRIDCEFSGSTCTVAYLKGNTLTTAWVGDSRGVLGRVGKKGWEALDLTVDHKPTQPEEKARILASQGRVERLLDETGQPMGPYRVWLQYAWIPGLAMSRAFGDQLAHEVGVSTEPGIMALELTPADQLLILASDGVWEFISSKEAVEIVGPAPSPEEGCRLLVEEAYKRWLHEEEGVVDDITAVVIKLIHCSEQQ